jgi:hypothetical protein
LGYLRKEPDSTLNQQKTLLSERNLAHGFLSACPQEAARRQAKTGATNLQHLQALREWLLPDGSNFSKLVFHGNSKRTPACLMWSALCWAWCDARNVTDAFDEAVLTCQK